jgi:glycine/D-amino acid oxidase-like deaminating enzyme
MDRKSKIAIIGGGIIGCSIAYYLSKNGECDVVVFERLGRLGDWETAVSVAMVMHQTGNEYMTELAKFSIEEYEKFNSIESSVGFRRVGSVLYTKKADNIFEIERRVELQSNLGVPSKKLSNAEIKKLAPFVKVDDILCGCHCPVDGYVNPCEVIKFLEREAKNAGVEFIMNHEARIIVSNSNYSKTIEKIIASYVETKVDNKTGETQYECTNETSEFDGFDYVINATGGLGNLTALTANETLPITTNIRRVAVVAPRFNINSFPILEDIDVDSEWYLRPYDGNTLLFGEGPTTPYEVNIENRYAKPTWDESDLYEKLTDYMSIRTPELMKEPIKTSWAGFRSYSENELPIVENSSSVQGLIHCCGMSGFGVSIAPACGIKVLDLIKKGGAIKC